MNGRESDRRQLTLTCARTPSAGAAGAAARVRERGRAEQTGPASERRVGKGGEERGVRRRRDFDEPPRRLDRRLDATSR